MKRFQLPTYLKLTFLSSHRKPRHRNVGQRPNRQRDLHRTQRSLSVQLRGQRNQPVGPSFPRETHQPNPDAEEHHPSVVVPHTVIGPDHPAAGLTADQPDRSALARVGIGRRGTAFHQAVRVTFSVQGRKPDAHYGISVVASVRSGADVGLVGDWDDLRLPNPTASGHFLG